MSIGARDLLALPCLGIPYVIQMDHHVPVRQEVRSEDQSNSAMVEPANEFVLWHIAIYLASGLLLLIAYLTTVVPNDRRTSVALWLLFLPSIGWGLWRYDTLLRTGKANMTSHAGEVFSRMGTLHAILLVASLILTWTMLFTDWHVHEPFGPDSLANQSGNTAGVPFDFMLTGLEGMAMVIVFFIVIFTYGFIFTVVSVLPWIIAGFIRRSHARAYIRDLENRRANGPPFPSQAPQ